MKLTILRRRRRTSIRLEIGILALTVEFPTNRNLLKLALDNSE
jgi:hypothetical protein